MWSRDRCITLTVLQHSLSASNPADGDAFWTHGYLAVTAEFVEKTIKQISFAMHSDETQSDKNNTPSSFDARSPQWVAMGARVKSENTRSRFHTVSIMSCAVQNLDSHRGTRISKDMSRWKRHCSDEVAKICDVGKTHISVGVSGAVVQEKEIYHALTHQISVLVLQISIHSSATSSISRMSHPTTHRWEGKLNIGMRSDGWRIVTTARTVCDTLGARGCDELHVHRPRQHVLPLAAFTCCFHRRINPKLLHTIPTQEIAQFIAGATVPKKFVRKNNSLSRRLAKPGTPRNTKKALCWWTWSPVSNVEEAPSCGELGKRPISGSQNHVGSSITSFR